jgi:hypothetical protein
MLPAPNPKFDEEFRDPSPLPPTARLSPGYMMWGATISTSSAPLT